MRKGQVKYSRRYRPHRYPKTYREKKEISWKRRIIFFWVLFLILVLAYFLFFSPVFKIKEIKVSGNRAIGSEEIQNSLDGFLYKKFLFFFNRNNVFLATDNKLINILLNDFPRILSIKINKDIFKKTINLVIVERKETGIFCKEECYYIDAEGVIFEKAPQTSGSLILVIKDNSEREPELGSNVIEKNLMSELINLRIRLTSQLGLKVLDFIIEPGVSEDLRINTNEGWYILFDKSRDLQNQLIALQLVLKEKIKEERKNLEYVDLRIENRAYYK